MAKLKLYGTDVIELDLESNGICSISGNGVKNFKFQGTKVTDLQLESNSIGLGNSAADLAKHIPNTALLLTSYYDFALKNQFRKHANRVVLSEDTKIERVRL